MIGRAAYPPIFSRMSNITFFSKNKSQKPNCIRGPCTYVSMKLLSDLAFVHSRTLQASGIHGLLTEHTSSLISSSLSTSYIVACVNSHKFSVTVTHTLTYDNI
jgi:hypothetical protein